MKTYKISSESFWYDIDADFGSGGGVYILKCMNGEVPIPTQRLLSEDKDGILYIGSAISYHNRVIDLKKSIAPEYKSASHGAGVAYKSCEALQEQFPYTNLVVELIGSETPMKVEKQMIQEYREKFGEVPPLNAVG